MREVEFYLSLSQFNDDLEAIKAAERTISTAPDEVKEELLELMETNPTKYYERISELATGPLSVPEP